CRAHPTCLATRPSQRCSPLCLPPLPAGLRGLPSFPTRRSSDLGDDVREHVERNRVPADAFDRVHLELAAVDAELLLLPEPVGDVRRRDRAEERARRPRVDVEPKLDANAGPTGALLGSVTATSAE